MSIDKTYNAMVPNEIISRNVDVPNMPRTNAILERIEENNIEESFNYTYHDIKIKNQSKYILSDDMLSDNIELTNKKIIIYHTHTCESYTSSEKYNYNMTGNYRTTDYNFNVVKLGSELDEFLSNNGFTIIHNKDYHDYPAYNGSYERSLQTIEKIMAGNEDAQIVIDLHRDAVGDGSWYGPSVKINDQKVAQMMFVIGTDGGGLPHPNWIQNLNTALYIQKIANTIYPGLFRPIILRNSRYNQHVSSGACIIEVGATGNTLDECLLSIECLSNILSEAFK